VTRNPSGILLWAADTTCLFPDCGGSCPSAAYRIHDNTITSNTLGLSIENTAGVTVTRNRLANNVVFNVRVGGRTTRMALNNNDLSCHTGGATPCQIAISNEMNAPLGVNATSNYWGTTNAAAIPGLILDHADDPSLGTVTFQPFLRRPVSPGKDAE
jgi:parallel beta-helix repeat protein